MEPRDLFVGLGSNIEPHANVRRMLDYLLRLAPELDLSPIAVTAPVGIQGGGQVFLNLAVRLRTASASAEVKEYFNTVEVALGRDRTDPGRKQRDRPADLDILFALPVAAAVVPASIDLPTETYLRPQLDALLTYVGVGPAGATDPMASLTTVALDFHGTTVGPTCVTLRRRPSNPQETA